MTEPSRPHRFPPCEDCGGVQVGNLRLVSSNHVGLQPAARSFYFQPLLGLNALVCTSCARVRFFADNLYKLQESMGQHPEWYAW